MPEKKKKINKRKSGKKEVVENKVVEKKQIKSENKILRSILLVMLVISVLIAGFILVNNYLNNFEYKGVEFRIVKFCDAKPCLITYNTKLPVQGQNAEYNFYLRNDPRELDENVAFNGELKLADIMVVNGLEKFECDGYGIIGIENLKRLYSFIGISMIRDETATCDAAGRYMLINLQESNETSIEQFGPACYNIKINNCEILEGTERFMIETFVEINKVIDG